MQFGLLQLLSPPVRDDRHQASESICAQRDQEVYCAGSGRRANGHVFFI